MNNPTANKDNNNSKAEYHSHTHEHTHDCHGCDTHKTYVRDIKLNRNDPCFCGSGKKYKKCCIDNV